MRPFIQSKEETLKWIPQSFSDFMNSTRELDIYNIHVTTLMQPPQIAALTPLFPDNDIQNKVRMSLGTAFHDKTQDNDIQYKKLIRFNSLPPVEFNLVGTPDFSESWKSMSGDTVDEFVTDIKATSIYKIKKCLAESAAMKEIEELGGDVSQIRKSYPYSFDWIYQGSCYKYITNDETKARLFEIFVYPVHS